MSWEKFWSNIERFTVTLKGGIVEVKVSHKEKKITMVFPSFTTAGAFLMIIGSNSEPRKFIDISYKNFPLSFEEDIPKIDNLAKKILTIIYGRRWINLPEEKEEVIKSTTPPTTPTNTPENKPPDSYTLSHHLNKIDDINCKQALSLLLEELEKKFSVSIKYFQNTIAIFIGTYKFMHITTMPSYFSLHIYRNVGKYILTDFEKISNYVKIDDDNIDIKIDKENQVLEILKLNL